MKVHKIEILVIDFDELGTDEVQDAIVNVRYPNDCISPKILSVRTVDIGEWDDDNPLNKHDTFDNEAKRLFATT